MNKLKNLFRTAFILSMTAFMLSFVISGLTVIVDKENGNMMKNGDVKSVNFKIKGLNTKADVDALLAKARVYQFVKSVSISSEVVNGTRECSASFDQSVKKSYFNKLFLQMGVETVVMGTKTIPASEFGKE